MIDIVLGTNFGDEGKGQAVLALSHSNSLVIRFSGGHQCGHTAIDQDGKRHVFSQFGAGTFKGAATYFSEYCTVFPTAFRNEYIALNDLMAKLPTYYDHPLTMLTTPYDLAFNRAVSMINGHGTCGVGFGSTIQRNEDYQNLYVNDLFNKYVLEVKMSFVRDYYLKKVGAMNMSSQITYEQELEKAMEYWEDDLEFYKQTIQVARLSELVNLHGHFVFEGSQGIMLDQHFGFFPHVTRTNTTSQNAMEIISSIPALKAKEITTYYISRCYQTRHGNGPFSDKPIELVNCESESNQENDWQGVFKTAELDPDLLKHAISCDKIYNTSNRKELIFTCFDQLVHKDSFLKEMENISTSMVVDAIQIKDQPAWII